MTDRYDGDVALIFSNDGAQIEYDSGQPLMDSGGLENAVLISLFTDKNWHGNALDENAPNKQIGSSFEETIKSKPITSQSLQDIEREGKAALKWFIDIGAAQEINVIATAHTRNRIDIIVEVTKPDETVISFLYELNWQASFTNPVINMGN
jgi:phage gp46-like protein